jgi:YidC/Oxa1 family membrane protein insertase
MSWLFQILTPIQWLLGWITVIFHNILMFFGFPSGPSTAWPIAIILMTLFIKVCLLPLLIRQIHATRRMQALAPEIKAIQKKYKNKTDTASKAAMSQETMALYSKNKANPMNSCLPMLFQGPILISLYGLLSSLVKISSGESDAIGPINKVVATEMEDSYFFFARLSDYFSTENLPAKITVIIVIAFMSIAMFFSQTLNIRLNTPIITQNDQQYKIQRYMSYVFPLIYIFTGTNVPMGVLVYWVVSNLWMLGQTLFQLHFIPTPGSKAAEAKETRDKKKELARGILPPEPEIVQPAQRSQPVSKKRTKKRK